MIDRTPQPLQRGRNWCCLRFRVYWPAHVHVWHNINSPHTLERPLGIVLVYDVSSSGVISIPLYQFLKIATFGQDGGSVPIYEVSPMAETHWCSIWESSVKLTSHRRTSLPSIETSFWPKLASRHPCVQTWHCALSWRDTMWLYASSTSEGSKTSIASILPWHTSQSSIHPELWIKAAIPVFWVSKPLPSVNSPER